MSGDGFAAKALVPGERIANTPYRVVRPIGQGGMGAVYEVDHVGIGVRRALKVLQRHHGDRRDMAYRLCREARSLACFEHPNLVRVVDLLELDGARPAIVMELLCGRDLRDVLAREGVIAPFRAVDFIAQALDGLAAVHAAGFVHRDVKLENLFLCDDAVVKVVDFGVAKSTHGDDETTAPGVTLGTPRTMSPEQCALRTIDARTDLYSAGLSLYELVVGHGPFDDVRAEPHALRFAHCHRPPPRPSTVAPQAIPLALEAAISKALAKSPDERFQSAAEMATALRKIFEAPVAPSNAVAARRPPMRKRTSAALTVVAAASFALGFAASCALPGGALDDASVAGVFRGPP